MNAKNQYAIYLRKSRADLEAEAMGQGETLARHRRALTELAQQRGLNVVHVYQEIASADTIAGRPQMQALLSAVESGAYRGVIVNDADRLARGDGIDQGIVKQAFYSTGTLIITPFKTFDPADESDEDFFDFSLFMARFEYRKIKTRLQVGRSRSAADGNYLGTRVTYGYNRVRRTDRRGYTLEIDPERAEVVRMIFRLYAYGENGKTLGSDNIANRINAMGLKTDLGNAFTADYIRHMLQNPNYIGTTSWNKRTKRVHLEDGKKVITREKNANAIYVENAHPAIIEKDLWDRVQAMFAAHAKLPKNSYAPVSNVLAGLIVCSECGRHMQRRPGVGSYPDTLRCMTKGCPTSGIYIPIIENTLLYVLEEWAIEYGAPDYQIPDTQESKPSEMIRRQIDTLNSQMDRLHDLLEQGIYTPTVFVQRRDALAARITAAQTELDQLSHTPTRDELIVKNLPQIRHVLDVYPITNDLQQKNALLRSVISKVVYHKTKLCKRNENPADYMELDIYPTTTSIK